MADKLTDFNLPTNAYTAFDALSLKNLIKDRLNQKSFFTDQNYEGSNLSSMIDIVAYSYHVLLFYLNQTSSESTFTETELYASKSDALPGPTAINSPCPYLICVYCTILEPSTLGAVESIQVAPLSIL